MAQQRSRIIEAGWRQYAEHVLPQGAGKVQMQECRRAFYMGAAHLFVALTDAIGPDTVSEDDGVAIMAGVPLEVEAFMADVRQGRA